MQKLRNEFKKGRREIIYIGNLRDIIDYNDKDKDIFSDGKFFYKLYDFS